MLLKIDPFRSFGNTTRKMSLLMGELEKGINFEMGAFKPRVDISEDSANVYIIAELPGMSKEDVKITINEENMLIIKGEKKSSIGVSSTSHRTERIFGSFERTFVLPENIATDNVQAKFENGLLELTIAKVEPPKPKEMVVTIS
jgi:HSP20 family protein